MEAAGTGVRVAEEGSEGEVDSSEGSGGGGGSDVEAEGQRWSV